MCKNKRKNTSEKATVYKTVGTICIYTADCKITPPPPPRKRLAADDESGPSTSGAVAKKSKGKTSFGDFSSW